MAILIFMWGRTRRLGTLTLAALAATTLLIGCAGADQPEQSAGSMTADAPEAMPTAAPLGPVPQFGPPPPPVEDAKRDVVKTASMTVTVGDTSTAADKAAVIAEDAKGRVDSRTEDAGSGRGRAETSVVLRVPAAELDSVVRELKTLGTVQRAETRAEDVTAQRVDLDARIKALQTSVDRLLAIMRDAKDSEALIQAEQALSQRQAELDSLRAQRDQLGDQIALSTIDVTFVAEQIGGPDPQQYQGFFGQIHRGWDALVTAVGNVFLLFGLMLPWLGALAVVGLVCYVFFWVRGARAPPDPAMAPTHALTTIPGPSRGSSEEAGPKESGGPPDSTLEQ